MGNFSKGSKREDEGVSGEGREEETPLFSCGGIHFRDHFAAKS